MAFPPLHKSAGLYLSWVGWLCGAIILMLGEFLPFRLTFATPGNFFASIVSLEIFFVLLVWPLFVPTILREGTVAPALLIHVVTMLVFALPLILIAANIASVEAAGVFRSQIHVAALASLGAGVAARLRPALPWYLLGVFWMSAALPFWEFLQSQLGLKAPAISVYVSPFWGAVASQNAPAWVQTGLFGVAGVALLALGRKPVSA
jgi:hypothetical protein